MGRFSRVLTILAVVTASESRAAESIEPGHVLLLKAEIAGCDAPAQTIDFVEVPESGEVLFFERFDGSEEVSLSVNGRTAREAAEALADKIEARDDYRPRTLEIIVLSGRGIIEAKSEIFKAATRNTLFPCGFRRPRLKPFPNWNEAPDLPPLETKNLAQKMRRPYHETPAA